MHALRPVLERLTRFAGDRVCAPGASRHASLVRKSGASLNFPPGMPPRFSPGGIFLGQKERNMTWETLPKTTAKAKVNPAHVVFSARKFGKFGATLHKLQFGASVRANLGWADEDAVLIEWGAGEHRGQLRLTPVADITPETAVLRVSKLGEGRLSLGRVPVDADVRDRAVETVTYKTFSPFAGGKKGLVVTLPDDFLPVPEDTEGAGK